MKTLIWQRYFVKEILKVFFLFLFSFYFLYVLIDYSAHSKAFLHENLTFGDICLYYLLQFTKRGDVLIPVALLLGTIKVLTLSTIRNEITALVTGGIGLRLLLSPLLWCAAGGALLLYANFQWLQPAALNQIESFESKYFKENSSSEGGGRVHTLVLKDHSLLLYQLYDRKEEAFFDVFWLKDFDHMYRIHSFFPASCRAHFVDELVREPEGELLKVASTEEAFFPAITWETNALFEAVYPTRQQSITQLFHQARFKGGHLNDRQAEATSFFLYKLLFPLTCFLVVLAPAPYCLRFSRNLPVFRIFALSLFALIAYFTVINAALIVGEAQVFSPLWALLTPFFLVFLVGGWKYARL